MDVNHSIVPFKEKHWFLTHPSDGSVHKDETLLKSSGFEPQFHQKPNAKLCQRVQKVSNTVQLNPIFKKSHKNGKISPCSSWWFNHFTPSPVAIKISKSSAPGSRSHGRSAWSPRCPSERSGSSPPGKKHTEQRGDFSPTKMVIWPTRILIQSKEYIILVSEIMIKVPKSAIEHNL